ncbi:ABC transporter substrate-binding protein [Demequina sp. SYSU T00192]|uniref:ABC transporter substrate-binding protein n=1 Tax=Demequina litoralis TaxID=3051660 RepID=A0ABT8G6J5_9MICO|nr:ABC transporter substrate-binding protein [Demequina sp. SYSU T00192]MDN4474743.1 ABC transporter substrate-binding protein [Demequina sp. SYSU T00192]
MFHRGTVIWAAIGATALAGCAGATASTDAAPSADGTAAAAASSPVLRLGMVDAPGANGFVAAEMSFATHSAYGQAVYDTLVRAEPDNSILPSLATGFEYNEDGTVLTMSLRDDVTFTDGTPFTADVAVANLLRFRDGSSENAAWLAGVSKVEAIGDETVEVTLTAPDPALLTNLSKAAGYMESPSSFDDPAPVGTGPYLLDAAQTVEGETYVFTANPDYWDPERQHYDQVVMTVHEDAGELQEELVGNRLDAVLYTGYSGFGQIEAAGYSAHEFTLDWTGLLLFDRAGAVEPALADVRVRRAINYALDREALLDALLGGRGEVTSQIFGPHTPGFEEDLEEAYPHSPAKAKALLAEAGYADGLSLTIPTVNFVPEATFNLLREQLRKVGITAVLTPVAAQDYFGAVLGGQFGLASMQLEQPASAWETYNLSIATGAPWNAMHVADEWVDLLAEKMQTGDDAAARALNDHVVDEAWFAPWYRNLQVFYTAEGTDATLQVGNAYPYLWNIVPADA